MRSNHLIPALALAGCVATALTLSAPARADGGVVHRWVGNSQNSGGDDHSFTDPRNWSPAGVPGTGDTALIVASPDVCSIDVDAVPATVALAGLSVSASGSHSSLCSPRIAGGRVRVTGRFDWDGGELDTPLTLAAGANGTVNGTHVDPERLDADLTIAGRLTLSGVAADAPLMVTRPHTVRVTAAGSLRSMGDNHIGDISCCTDPAHLVNDGTVLLSNGTLRVDGVQIDQRGTLAADHGVLYLRSAPAGATSGASYTGSGSWVLATGGNAARLSGTQHLGPQFHLRLGDRAARAGADLGGRFGLDGSGTFDWDGGVIEGDLTVGRHVTVVARGATNGNDRRILRGIDHSDPRTPRSALTNHGRFVLGAQAIVTTGETGHVINAGSGVLTVGAGAGFTARTCCSNPDRLDNNATIRFASSARFVGLDLGQGRRGTLALDVDGRSRRALGAGGAAIVAGRIVVHDPGHVPAVGSQVTVVRAEGRVRATACVQTTGPGAARRHWAPARGTGRTLVLVVKAGRTPAC